MQRPVNDVVKAARRAGPADVAGALAMRRNGFTEADVVLVYGYGPPDVTPGQFRTAFARDLAAATTGWKRAGSRDRHPGATRL